ncbi:MAG: helix-turn-helix domain-containing protein [Schleiferiaceae bacterium]|jgi:AraC-like DNA-binding protein|nr:helix-turn-helix domain-containing protein [Schleiferiaceae bacterium]
MKEITPKSVKDVSEMLESLHLKKYQRHEHFHILKFQDHYHEMALKAHLKSEGYFEMTFARNHNTKIEVDQKVVKEATSSLFFLSPGQTIKIEAQDLAEDSLGFMVLFSVDFLNFSSSEFAVIQQFPYFNIHLSPSYELSPEQDLLFASYLERLNEEFKKLDNNNLEIVRSLLTICLFEAKRLLDLNQVKRTITSRAEEVTYQFENLLKNTAHKKQKLGYYSSQLHISDVYLSECVKKTTGKPAKKLITAYMLFEAKDLLRSSDTTIENIALQMGFSDTPNFISFFKKNAGLTPNQFRKS